MLPATPYFSKSWLKLAASTDIRPLFLSCVIFIHCSGLIVLELRTRINVVNYVLKKLLLDEVISGGVTQRAPIQKRNIYFLENQSIQRKQVQPRGISSLSQALVLYIYILKKYICHQKRNCFYSTLWLSYTGPILHSAIITALIQKD